MIHIIGDGLSGLAAANYSNSKKIFGLKESRIFTLNTNPRVDMGAQFFSKEDENFFSLVKKIKLEKHMKETKINQLVFEHKKEFFKINSNNFSKIEENTSSELKEFKKTMQLIENIIQEMPAELFETDFEKWYKKNIGPNSIWFVDSLLKSITFSKAKDVCAFYGLIACQSFFMKTYTFEEGLSKILNELNKNIKIEKDELTNINFSKDKVSSFCLKNKKVSVLNEKLITAIPSNVLSKIVDEKELSKKLGKIDYGGCSVLVVKTKKQITIKEPGIIFTNNKKIAAILKYEDYYTILAPYKNSQKSFTQEELIKELKIVTNTEDINVVSQKSWDYGLPTCSPKLANIQEEILEITNRYDNFAICGDFMGLPSLEACVESAKNAVKKIQKI